MAISFDTETALFRPGVMAPELACVTYAGAAGTGLLHWTESRAALEAWLRSGERLVGHFVAYDMAVICAQFPDLVPLVFAAYDADRVTDTKIRMQLIDIAQGTYRGRAASDGTWIKYGYTLLEVTKRLTGRLLEKDEWRLKYGELRPLPLAQWPAGAVKYATDDAIATLDCYEKQESAPKEWLVDQFRQARADFALHLSSCWGLKTYKPGVDAIRARVSREIVDVTARLVAAGLVRADGSRDTKAAAAYMIAVCKRDELPLRKTKGEGVCLDSDACDETEDPLLVDYGKRTKLQKTLSADIPMLEAGAQFPVHTRYGIAASSRTTSSGPNIQNFSKKGGVREAFIPRPGKVFIQGDYPQLELYTLAQCCYTWLGYSTLGEMLKRGIDPHTSFAAKLAGVSYEEGLLRSKAKTPEGKHFKDYLRQIGKVFNFGKPGGLGPAKLVTLAATDAYGNVTITEDQAREYGKIWLETLPEMKDYFARVNQLIKNPAKLATITLPGVGFVRGGCMYCAACNTGFQGLGAACAKNAMWHVARAQYAQPSSPIYGARTVWFAHDEIGAEADECTCHESSHELVRLMRVAANEFLPDVPYTEEKLADVPTVMRFWSKDATQVFDARGRLIPWEGKEAA